MKRYLHHYAFLVLLFSSSSFVFSQQITVDASVPLDQLILNNLIEGCVEISNITSAVNGSTFGLSSYAYFNRGSSNFPFQDGVMLSTGNAESGGNSLRTPTLSEGSTIWGTDPDLESALSAFGITNTLNATSIEFDLISATNQVQFNYLLASEEYFGINPCQFSDGFVFLIKQTGSAGPYQNIALVPGTGTPVSTNSIHDEIYGNNGSICSAQNAQYFDGYNLGDTNYNGRTVPLSATATITPYVQYHIKLIIADQTDLNYDSAVFIQAISFDNLDLGDDIVTCLNFATLNADIQNPQASYTWFLNNTLINGETNSTLNVTQNGTYKVEVSVPLNNNTCLLEDDIQVTLNSEPIVDPIPDYELCDNSIGIGVETFDLQTKVSEILNILPAGNYNLTFHYTEAEARSAINAITTPIQNTANPQTIYVTVENLDTGCFSYAPFDLIVNPLPNIITPSNLKVCDNDATPNGITDINLTEKDDEITSGNTNLIVTYHFTQADADTGNNPIISPYVNSSSPNQQSVFVRVVDSQTGCVNTTTLTVDIINSPIVNTDTQFIDACDADHDGTATFDLTEVIPSVLNGLPASGVTITFHTSYADAESGSNAIANETNYQNINPDVQTVFIRVEDNITGCPSIVPIEVHTNLLLTGTDIGDFALCADNEGQTTGDFYLNVLTDFIANDLPNIAVTYYETQTDLDSSTNAISVSPYIATSPKTIFINIENTVTGCSEQAEIKLLVNPILLFNQVAPIEYCDDDDDGSINVDLHSLDETINSGNSNFEVYYFLTEQQAINNNPNDELLFYDVNGTQTFWARIENIESGCHTENSFDIKVVPAPTATEPSGFIVCDSDQDGISIINLEDKIPEIVPDTTGLNIGFFTSLSDAETKTNPIADPTIFNASTQDIFVRVESNISNCFNIVTLNIIVSTQPAFPSISNYEICVDNGVNQADFLLSEKDNEILNGQAGKEVLYFEDPNYTIPIDKNTLYQNTSSPQTIYVRVQNIIDPSCYGDSSFSIEVSQNPVYNTNFNNYLICDDISNDGKNEFNLDEKKAEIAQGSSTLNISFHINQQDADDNVNPLPSQYTNDTNPQTIYVRIEESNSICYVVEELGINIIAAPDVTEASPFIQCDEDYDGSTSFNLNDADFELLDRITTDLEISYFENEDDVEDVSQQIPDPSNYNNIANPQTVYIKVTNTITECYSVIPLDLIVNIPPTTNAIGTIQICDNDTKTYDLSQLNNVIVDDNTTVNLSYHSNLNDAENNANPLPDIFNYTSNFYTFYARIEDPNTGCVIIPSFNLQINPNPVAVAPPNLEGCDDDYDGFLVFDLSQQKNNIVGAENPDDYTVTYYTSPEDAENNENALSNSHSSFDGETIYARMENNQTGCFDTTSFSTTIFPLATININDIVPLCNDLPLIIDANTGDAGDTYLWSTGETNSQILVQPENIGNYWVTVTNSNNCQSTKAFTIIKSEDATINFTTTVDFADPNSITVDVSGIGNYVYILDDGEPQTSNVFDYVTLGLHTVTIRDLNGCNDVSKEVFVIDAPKFMTPNNDGDFDTWQIVGIEQLPGTVVYIYDRHGKLLKTLPSTSIGWDGTFRGQNMPSDDYWFVAKVFKDGSSFDVKGHFALKR